MENNNNNNSNSFGDLLGKRPNDDSHVSERQAREREAVREQAAADEHAHYFSYGPYKSGSADTTASDSAGTTPVEVTPPKAVRPFQYASHDENGDNGLGTWQVGGQPPKRSAGFRSIFGAFMAGVLVVGGLMFAADKYNVFTGAQTALRSGNGAAAAPAVATPGSGGGVQPTALDLTRPNNISSIFQQASPAVVKIETKVKTKAKSSGNPLFDDPFFRQFFGDDSGSSQQPKTDGQLQPGGMGTGFIFEKNGYILTNEHVIDGADEIWVYVQGYEKPFKAQLLGNSFELDLAALKIEGDKEFPILPIGDSNGVKEGDWVVAIGNPYGFDHTVTVGVVSAKERPISIPDSSGTREYKHLLQTDASINPGNSGGPLLNLNGEVIGINTAVSAQAQGIGFAIPTSTISTVLDNLKNNVKIPIPYIGVQLSDIDKDWVSELKLENAEGAIVRDVVRKSPAFKAGLRPYDVITEVNGAKVAKAAQATEQIQKLKVGDKASITIIRDGKKQAVEVTVGNRNEAEKQS